MNNESRTRRRAAPPAILALLFLFGAFAARATIVPQPHATLNGIAGINLHDTFAVWTSDHSGTGHFAATIYWDTSNLALITAGAVSSNGPKTFEVQGTHNYAGPVDPLIHEKTYYGYVHVTDSQDDSSADIDFTVVIHNSGLVPAALAADDDSDAETNSDVDGIFEFGETILLNPSWSNEADNLNNIAGTLAPGSFTRDGITAGETYTIVQGAAEYGNMAKFDVHDCFNGNVPCYRLLATLTGPRPQAHMDAKVTEEVTGNVSHTWDLHMGGSFADVAVNSMFYRNIETILHNGVTTGTTATTFGPSLKVTRGQMAAFLARGFLGGDANVPTAGASYDCTGGGQSLFADVAPTNMFCRHINYIAQKKITLGCADGSIYCPNFNITRGEAAVFLARSQPPINPGTETDVPTAYADPVTARSYDCNVATADVPFSDVPATHPFCKYVGYIWAKGIVDGYANGTFGPTNLVSREHMAKMLDRGLALTLYHP